MKKFGEVLDYRTAKKAVVGKKYVFGNILKVVCENPELCSVGNLSKIYRDSVNGFSFECDNGGVIYQFCREVVEEEQVLMTHIQLLEWLSKGNGIKGCIDSCDGTIPSAYTTHTFDLDYADDQVAQSIRIRSWGSDDWVEPTVDIYERDCKGGK